MTTTMIERVAKALAGGDWDSCPNDHDRWRRDARDAIEAMRSPTKMMYVAANNAFVPPADAAACWSAMISAALKEEAP